MYGKVFASLWSGSMYAKTDAQLVFIYMLCNCDRHGVLDVTQEAIAGPVGMSVDRVRAAIEYLESPDARSRTNGNDGRRILRMDEHRDWGWQIVNYQHYRDLRDEEQRRESNRARMRTVRAQKRTDVHSAHCAPKCAHAEAEGEAEHSLPSATLREGTRFARADSYEPNTNLKESSPGTRSEHAGASNGTSSGVSGGRETAAGLCTLGSVLDGIAARLGSQNAQEGPAVGAGPRDGAEDESEAKSDAERDPGANAEVREYVAPVYEIAKPYGAAIATKTLALCGRLFNAGRRSTIFLQTVARHYVEHRGEIREPEAFYSGKTVGSEGLLMDLAAQSVIAEHQRQAAETGAWLKGSRP